MKKPPSRKESAIIGRLLMKIEAFQREYGHKPSELQLGSATYLRLCKDVKLYVHPSMKATPLVTDFNGIPIYVDHTRDILEVFCHDGACPTLEVAYG